MFLMLTVMNFPYMLGCLLFITDGLSDGIARILPLLIALILLGITYYCALKDYRFAVWINIFTLMAVTTYLLRDGWMTIIDLSLAYFR